MISGTLAEANGRGTESELVLTWDVGRVEESVCSAGTAAGVNADGAAASDSRSFLGSCLGAGVARVPLGAGRV